MLDYLEISKEYEAGVSLLDLGIKYKIDKSQICRAFNRLGIKKKTEKRDCARCGLGFLAKRKVTQYCSDKCRNRANGARHGKKWALKNKAKLNKRFAVYSKKRYHADPEYRERVLMRNRTFYKTRFLKDPNWINRRSERDRSRKASVRVLQMINAASQIKL